MSQVTIFKNHQGLLTKRATLDQDGRLHLSSSAHLSQGEFRTLRVDTVDELANVIEGLSATEALAFGVSRTGVDSGSVVTTTALAKMNGAAPGDVVARSREYFEWPPGKGWLMVDFDLDALDDAAKLRLGDCSLLGLRTILLTCAPGLASCPMLALPSASACLYRVSDGKRIRGLTGARFYVLAAHAQEIPEIGRRLHERLMLHGYGFAFVSKAGTISLRSLIDTSVWTPERLDFVGGASCGEGITQRRGTAERWQGDGRPLGLAECPPLSADERAALSTSEDGLRLEATPRAQQAHAEFVARRQLAGHLVAISWKRAGEVEFLDGGHEIELHNGTWVSIDQVLADPTRYHMMSCADPVDPESNDNDRRIAKIYTVGQTTGPAIHSFAHGGSTFMLRRSAAAEFEPVDPPATSLQQTPVGVTPGERIAALLGEASRPFLLELSAIGDGEIRERWEAFCAAASNSDPLKEAFRTIVIPAARSIPSDELGQFGILLDAALSASERDGRRWWLELPTAERQLLIRAAYALFARLGRLTERLSDSPGDPIRIAQVDRDYLVDELIPARSVAAFVGPPGQGKSFLALELSLRTARRPADGKCERFGGLPVQHGSVLYCASEDVDGLSNRAVSWAAVHGNVGPHLHIFGRVPPLSSLDRAIAFILAAIERALTPGAPPLRLIVIDVLRAAVEGEENSSDVIGPAMVTAGILSKMTGATVLIVHHAAINDPERGRGSSAFTAAQDVIAAVAQDERGISLKVKKNKSGPGGLMLTWHLDGGVLRDGQAALDVSRNPTEAGSLVAGRAIREIARGDVGVSRRQLAAAMSEACPELFGPQVNPKTVDTRVTRAIKAAVDQEWVRSSGGKFFPGSNDPPTAPADFEAVE